jgi:endonuclease/exonuclease/phosphatase family metal-dependent hydrolase
MFAKGSKTRRASPADAISVLKNLNADIVVIPEFGRRDLLASKTLQALMKLSYTYVLSDYDDERAPALCFAVLSKLPVTRHRTVLLDGGTRPALLAECQLSDGTSLRIIGIHLDDRNESIRMQQIVSIVETVNESNRAPMLVLGDFNAMSQNSRFARFARSHMVRMVTHLMPHRQLRSIIERVSEMAMGTTVNYLLDRTSLRSLDPRMQATVSAKQAGMEWMPSWRIAKIDWIFATVGIAAQSYVIFKDVGSDHRPVIADITIANSNDHRA